MRACCGSVGRSDVCAEAVVRAPALVALVLVVLTPASGVISLDIVGQQPAGGGPAVISGALRSATVPTASQAAAQPGWQPGRVRRPDGARGDDLWR